MWLVLPYLAILVVVVVANIGVSRRGWRWATYGALAVLNAGAFAWGALALLLPTLLVLTGASPEAAEPGASLRNLGIVTAIGSLIASLCLLRPVRRVLARRVPLDPTSPVHTAALVLYVHLASSSLGLLSIGQDWMLGGLQAVQADVTSVVSGQVVFLLLALAGVGLGVRRSLEATLRRLNLHLPTAKQALLALAATVALLAIDYGVSRVWEQLWPTNYEQVMSMSEMLFSQFATPVGALLLGVSAGMGEEILFRGALQPRFGLLLTTVLFACGHVQYGLSPALLEILVMGFALGYVRDRANTGTCVLIHAGYNTLSMLLATHWS